MKILAIAVVVAGLSSGAASAEPKAVSIGMLHLNTTSLDQSLALYKDVLGMELIAPVPAPRAVNGLVSEPGAMLRAAQLRVPGGAVPFQMELVEWTGTPLRPQTPRIQDPGEVMLAFNVRGMDAKLAAVKRLGLSIITRNGEPYISEGRGGRNRAVMLRDPSGFIVELTDVEANPANATNPNLPAGNITSVGMFITVQDLAQTVNFYNKAFGLNIMAPAGTANPANERIKALFNDPSIATMRTARATFPGNFTINFQEFTGPARKAVHHRAQDPGGPILLINVDDFAGAIDAIKANGGTIGDGDTSVALAPNATSTWTRDPNGVLIRVSPPPQPRAGGAGRNGGAAAPAPGRQ